MDYCIEGWAYQWILGLEIKCHEVCDQGEIGGVMMS